MSGQYLDYLIFFLEGQGEGDLALTLFLLFTEDVWVNYPTMCLSSRSPQNLEQGLSKKTASRTKSLHILIPACIKQIS